MKILHVTANYSDRGGAERYVLDICAALEQENHEVVVLSSVRQDGLSVPNSKAICLPPSYGLRSTLGSSTRKYRELIENEKPDLIHVHNTQYHINPLTLLTFTRGIPTVKFVHDVRPFCPTGFKVLPRTDSLCARPMGRKCWNRQGCLPFAAENPTLIGSLRRFTLVATELHALRRFDRLIVGSRYMAGELLRNGVDSNKVTVLPNYTTLREPKPEDPPDPPTILCLGQFIRIKGMPQLIESMAHMRPGPWRIKLVGDGPLLDDCMNRVAELNLEDRVQFSPPVPYSHLEQILRSASIVVVPSIAPEAFALVGIEAMACGRPVIAFDAGGIREWCIDGVTGIVVPRGDLIALARAIESLLDDPSRARAIGARGRRLVDTRFRLNDHLKGLLSVYDAAIESRRLSESGRTDH
jgi:glycosyltransferase involved in cell wall biosynthesis